MERKAGKQVAAYGLLAVSLVIAYQSWVNSTLSPEVQTLSKEAAMTISAVDESRPRMQRSDPVRQRYEWHTSVGPVMVHCRRDLIFFGSWNCSAERGTMGSF